MVGVILIQRSEGGALSGLGGGTMGGMMTARGTANLLTRTTAILAGCFMATSLVLAILAGQAQRGARSSTGRPPPATGPRRRRPPPPAGRPSRRHRSPSSVRRSIAEPPRRLASIAGEAGDHTGDR